MTTSGLLGGNSPKMKISIKTPKPYEQMATEELCQLLAALDHEAQKVALEIPSSRERQQ